LDPNDKIQRDNHLNAANAPGQLPDSLDAEVVDVTGPPSLGDWLKTNSPMLLVVAVLAGVLAWFFDVAGLLTIAKVGVGLGFIIFIHELGHFLVAKWCDVHVTTFSIGFGPAIPGCSWTWGETTYKLAILPLGGYVQMVGQVDGDESSDGSEDDPRSYKNKSVWQRMAIISAGVIMNALFACIAFTVVFLGPGKPRTAALIREVDSGKPAFTKGVRSGAEILRVNQIEKPYFEDLKYEVVATVGPITIWTQRRHGVDPQKRDVDLQPVEMDITPHQGSFRMIGIAPAPRLMLAPHKAAPDFSVPALPGSAAAKAYPAFEFDDVIVGVTNPEFLHDPAKMLLPDDPRRGDGQMKDFFEFQRRMTLLAGKEVVIRVERGPEGNKHTVDIKVPPAFHKTLGVRLRMGQITAVRENSPAADPKTGVLIPRAGNGQEQAYKLKGDVIEEVEVTLPDGNKQSWKKGKDLDPLRLPFQLKEWADSLWKARSGNPPAAERKVKLFLKRQSVQNAGPVFLPNPVVVELEWDYGWRFDRVLPLAPTSPQAIPELGLAYLVNNEVDGLEEGVKSWPLEKDDEIVDVNFVFTRPDGEIKERGWETKAIKGSEWAYLSWRMQSPELVKVKLKIKRAGKEPQVVEIEPRVDQRWPDDERGLMLTFDSRVERANNVLQAIEMGFRDTFRSMMQVYLHLRGLIAGTISAEHLGGPVTIATTAYRVAQYDFWEFVFFLGLISVNLAVLNFLPIPVLDGGHMVFLIYEKLRGKPASEGVRVGATYAGLLLIGCLMIFVLVLDVRRLVGGG
jgi:regulator of sigma E protease